MEEHGSYMIITLAFTHKNFELDMLMSVNDSYYFKRCFTIADYYDRHYGAKVFFRDTENKLDMPADFVEVEYNFDIKDKEKEILSDMLKVFFANGYIDRASVEEYNYLRAVIFKKTDGKISFPVGCEYGFKRLERQKMYL